jgi:hypothetical protein
MMPDEQLQAEFGFERGDRGREGGLREVGPLGRQRDAADFPGRHEIAELPQREAHRIPARRILRLWAPMKITASFE